MTLLPIVISPDIRLKKVSKSVESVDDSIRKLMDDMLETMYESKGIGLAAVQIGVLKRVLVIDVSYGSPRYTESIGDIETHSSNPVYMANPKIIKQSDEQNIYEEGCLSFPDQYGEVTRPKQVTVEYLDYDGEKQMLEVDNLLSTCIQHEIDHLNGITFIDHLSRMKRNIIIKKMNKQA